MVLYMSQHSHATLKYFSESFAIVVGLVLIWRGIWYTLDAIDRLAFGGNHDLTALAGIIIGLLILYLPDRDLKELRKL